MNKLKSFFTKSKKRAYGLLALALAVTGMVGTMAYFTDHIEAQLYLTIAAWKGEPIIQEWKEDATTDFHAYKETITSITFIDHFDTESDTYKNKTSEVWDVSHAQDESVQAYMVGTDVYICSDVGRKAQIIANPYSSYAYCYFESLETIDGEHNLDTSHAITMEGMFKYTGNLEYGGTIPDLDLTSWDTSKVKSMKSMFQGSLFNTLDVSKLNTSAVEDMSFTFAYFYSDPDVLDISNWDVSSVKTMESMFDTTFYSSKFTLDVSKWVPKNVTNMNNMFAYGEYLETLDVSGWDVGKLETAENMFFCCTRLESLGAKGLSEWNTGSLKKTTAMFQNCDDLPVADISNWNMSKITSSDRMFSGCSSLTELSIPATYKNVGNHFAAYCTSLATINFGHTSVNPIIFPEAGEDTGAFYLDDYLATTVNTTEADIMYGYRWHVGHDNRRLIPTLSRDDTWQYTTYWGDTGDYSYETPIDLDTLTTIEIVDYYMPDGTETKWEISDPSVPGTVTAYLSADKTKVTIAGNGYGLIYANEYSNSTFSFYNNYYSFTNLTRINGAELLDVSNVVEACDMFASNGKLEYVNVSNWDTGKIKYTSSGYSGMFSSCYSLDTLDVSNWDTSSMEDMTRMFDGCSSLTELDVSKWDTSACESTMDMFYGCSGLSEINVNTKTVNAGTADEYIAWDVSNVENTAGMFAETTGLETINLSDWNTESIWTMRRMFYGSGIESIDLSTWNESTVTNVEGMFETCANLTDLNLVGWDLSHVTNSSTMLRFCTALETVTFPANLVNYGSFFADGCTELTTIEFLHESDADLTFHNPNGGYGGAFPVSDPFSKTDPLRTKVITSNTDVLNYGWTNDYRGFVVTVDAQTGGTLTANPKVAINGKKINLTVVTSDNYDYNGATVTYTDENGVAQSFDLAPGEKSFTMPVADVTITPEFEFQSFTVTYDANKGAFTDKSTSNQVTYARDTKSIVTGTEKTPAHTQKEFDQTFDLEFMGWYLNQACTEGYECTDDCLLDLSKVTSDITVYAKWRYVPVLAKRYSWYDNSNTTIKRTQISSIVMVDEYDVSGKTIVDQWDASTLWDGTATDDHGPVTAYLEDDGLGKNTYKLTIAGNGFTKVYANKDSFYAFSDSTSGTPDYFSVMTSFDGLALLDTQYATDMTGMFRNCNALETLDVSGFDTSKVTGMSYMFAGCQALKELDVSGFDTTKVTGMANMFQFCSSVKALDVSGFDTKNVADMTDMFSNCGKLETLDVSGFDTSKVISMANMFRNDYLLQTIDVSGFNTSNVTTMINMFSLCTKVETLDVSGFDTSKVTNMASMFSGCNSVKALDVSGFNTANVTNMNTMFYACFLIQELDVSNFNTSKVTDMSNMFCHLRKVQTLDVSGFDTSKVTNMAQMFASCHSLTTLDVSGFDTGLVTSFADMFRECYTLESLNVSGFDTSKVTNTAQMFRSCWLVPTLDIQNWDMSKVTQTQYMFYDCYGLTSLTIPASLSKIDAWFAYDCGNLTTITFLHDASDSLTIYAASSPATDGVFYCYNEDPAVTKNTNVIADHAAVIGYNWAGDFRNATFSGLPVMMSLRYDPATGTVGGYNVSK